MEQQKKLTDEKASAKKKVGAKGSAQGRNKLKCQRYKAKGLHEKRKAARIIRYMSSQGNSIGDKASMKALRELQDAYPLTLKPLFPVIASIEKRHANYR